MVTYAEYVKVGRLEQMVEKGWFKIILKGKVIIITFLEADPIAIEIYDAADPNGPSLPPDFHPDISGMLDPLLDPPLESWGYLKTYPVKIEGENILVGFNPMD